MTDYRFHEFHTPTHAPFNGPDVPTIWFSIVGEFIAPIVHGEKDLIYWFCFHGADFQFCFVAPDIAAIEKKIEDQKKKFGIASKTPPTPGARVEFAGSPRWMAKSKIGNTSIEDRRGELVLRLLHATCALLIDQLVHDGQFWRLERNEDKQNPLGNSFESVLHLISNISQAEFDVYITASYQTAWMKAVPVPPLRCHL